MILPAPPADSGRVTIRGILSRALRPPLGDVAFWIVQGAVIALAGLHLYLDSVDGPASSILPTSSPVALLFVPVLYAALRYGLAGSAATALWASLLWLPDLFLPDGMGHPATDVIDLVIVLAVAVFVGVHIERGAVQRRRAESAEEARRAAQLRYRELFQTNPLPIVVLDAADVATEINPAACAAFGDQLVGERIGELFTVGGDPRPHGVAESVQSLMTAAGVTRTYRVITTRLTEADGVDAGRRQLVFQDVTEEHRKHAAARSFAALVLDAHEEERRRIARDIHDDPLQRLIALSRRLERPAGGGAVPSAAALAESRGELLEVIDHLRQLARGLRPPGLDQLGLVAAVRGWLADLDAPGSLRTELAVSGAPSRLEPGVELAAFRIIQEAAHNAIRHAAARVLRVELAYTGDALRARVIDDGIGFDVALSSGPLSRTMGVVGMRERADLLGGTLAVSSVSDQGTTVEAVLPLTPSARASAA